VEVSAAACALAKNLARISPGLISRCRRVVEVSQQRVHVAKIARGYLPVRFNGAVDRGSLRDGQARGKNYPRMPPGSISGCSSVAETSKVVITGDKNYPRMFSRSISPCRRVVRVSAVVDTRRKNSALISHRSISQCRTDLEVSGAASTRCENISRMFPSSILQLARIVEVSAMARTYSAKITRVYLLSNSRCTRIAEASIVMVARFNDRARIFARPDSGCSRCIQVPVHSAKYSADISGRFAAIKDLGKLFQLPLVAARFSHRERMSRVAR
jgi:hypothetical protein